MKLGLHCTPIRYKMLETEKKFVLHASKANDLEFAGTQGLAWKSERRTCGIWFYGKGGGG